MYRIRVPVEPRISPDGSRAVVSLQTTAPRHDGYRAALWLVDTNGESDPRQVTLGAKNDHQPRFSPDGRTLAFLSDRRLRVEEEPDRPTDEKAREDANQVHLLPLDGGEARRLTDLPRGVERFEWSPDGRHLAILTASLGATRREDARARGKSLDRKPADPPESDYRFIDRLGYMLNGPGFTYDRIPHLWIVDVATGEARRLVAGPTAESDLAWSPDGRRIAFTANRRRDHDLRFRSDIFVVDVDTARVTALSGGGDAVFAAPAWLPDGASVVAIGYRHPEAYRYDVRQFAADGADARAGGGRNLTSRHDLMPGSTMNSDVTPGEPMRVIPTGDGSAVLFTAPVNGSYELWRVSLASGDVDRLTVDKHYLSGWDAATIDGRERVVAIRSTPTKLPDLHVLEVERGDGSRGRTPGRLRQLTAFNADLETEVALCEPIERSWESGGRTIQGWLIPAAPGPQPLVTEIHGGPHTLYGFAPFWEWQVLAGSGVSVLASNPRGSEGYGKAFNEANLGDWGDGPMQDVIAGIEQAIADGLADSNRLGVTGGSYGGYLTNWILGKDQRFKAAITCRSVADMSMLFLTGDISGGEWAEIEFGARPWEDPELYRRISPLTHAREIRTPLLIQHSERDLRTTVGQAEALFTFLREHRRPVRLMRVPEETHELTRSGTPFRRVENLVQVRDWFVHFLVRGRKGLPPLPRVRGDR